MAGLRKKRRVQLIAICMTLLVGASVLIGIGAKDSINLFRSPSEVVSNPPRASEVFKLGGLVLEGSLVRGTEATFVVTDTNEDIPVRYVGLDPIPDLLAKHDEKYEPTEVINALSAQGVDITANN